MIPRLHFGFIICTYLPGIPLAWAFYHTLFIWVFKVSENVVFKTKEDTITTIYAAISPLIFGLAVDAVRHFLEHFFGGLSIREFRWRWTVFVKKIASGMKNKCMYWSHWDHLPKDKLNVTYQEEFIRHIINIYAVQYHMYEFFVNYSLSILAGLVVYLLWKNAIIELDYAIFFVCASAVFFLLGWIMSKQNKTLIDNYFS